MISLVYFLDALVLAGLTSAVTIGWLMLHRRSCGGRGKRPDATTIISFLLLAFVALQLWAQFRPVPVLVETRRAMTDAEKAQFTGRGIPPTMLTKLNVSEHKPFNGSNGGNWSLEKVRELKQLLAWRSICPRLPKEIIIKQKGFDSDFPAAEAYYNWVGGTRKSIGFKKSEYGWEIGRAEYISGCGTGPTNFLDKFISHVPVSLRIY